MRTNSFSSASYRDEKNMPHPSVLPGEFTEQKMLDLRVLYLQLRSIQQYREDHSSPSLSQLAW